MSRGRPPMPKTNPWGVTPANERALDLVIEHHSPKRAAQKTGVPLKSLESRLSAARDQMGAEFGDRLGYLLAWHKWRLTGVAEVKQ